MLAQMLQMFILYQRSTYTKGKLSDPSDEDHSFGPRQCSQFCTGHGDSLERRPYQAAILRDGSHF